MMHTTGGEVLSVDGSKYSMGQAMAIFESEEGQRVVAAHKASAAEIEATVPKATSLVRLSKQMGYSDVQLATVWGVTPLEVRWLRNQCGVLPVYKLVDTCAAEFEAATP